MGNIVVLHAFSSNEKIRTMNNMFILNLAIADLMIGLGKVTNMEPVDVISYISPVTVNRGFIIENGVSKPFLNIQIIGLFDMNIIIEYEIITTNKSASSFVID